MSYDRPLMWNVPLWAEIALYVLTPLVLAAFAVGCVWRVRKWLLGQAEPSGGSFRQRLARLCSASLLWSWFKTALCQSRLRIDAFSLVMHLAIFWGMLVLLIGTALATVDQDVTNLLFDRQILAGGFYNAFELAMDLFGVALIAGVAMAGYRRYLVRPPRLQNDQLGLTRWDAFPFLRVLALIAVTGFVVEGLRLAEGVHAQRLVADLAGQTPDARIAALKQQGFHIGSHLGETRRAEEMQRVAAGGPVFPAAAWAPVGNALAGLLVPLSLESLRGLHQGLWWIHAVLAFGLIVAVPFTKAFHLISAPVSLLLRTPRPVGNLPVVAESGAATVRDFTWEQLLQTDACTWCGKCQDACPSHTAGFPLSPRDVVQTVGSNLQRTPLRCNGNAPPLAGQAIAADSLWSCCTCRACEEVCPVCVQQPRLVVDLRRRLVDQGQVDEGLQDALQNLQRYGNSFGQSPRKRAEWVKPAALKLKDARKEPCEYLWFLGDYAAYDQRAQEVTRMIARVLLAAGVDLGTLGDKEQNAGNDVRRVGEEGLFAMLRDKNLAELAKAQFEAVLTTDPHTYNTLKNEYLNGDGAENPLRGKRVVHYSELLDELIAAGRLRLQPRPARVTYHDPCYLGRYNGVYAAPRRVLQALGVQLVEMPRHGPQSFCCGAGGGRVWMKDMPGVHERPAEHRVREALALPGVQCLVAACPKDFVMFQDAVKTVAADDRLRVVDLGELVFEALQSPVAAAAPATADQSPTLSEDA